MDIKKKEMLELGITCALVVVFLFAMIRAIDKAKKHNRPKIKNTAVETIKKVEAKENNLFHKLEEESAGLHLKRDPFTGIMIAPSSSAGAILSGILWSAEHPLAIINDTVVKPGDKEGDITIVEIKQDRVVINDGSKVSELLL